MSSCGSLSYNDGSSSISVHRHDQCGDTISNYTPSAISVPGTSDVYLPPFAAQETPPAEKFFGGFTGRFSGLWDTTMEHYLLVPALFVTIVAVAVSFEVIGFLMMVGAIGLVTYEIANASANLFLGDSNAGLKQMGEGVADGILLGGGCALGAGAKAVTGTENATRAGVALHLLDDVALGTVMATKAMQE